MMLNWVFVLLCSWQKRWDHLTFFSHSKIELWWSQKGMTCHHKLALGACLSSTQFSFNVLYVEIFKKSSSPCFVHTYFLKLSKVFINISRILFPSIPSFTGLVSLSVIVFLCIKQMISWKIWDCCLFSLGILNSSFT